MLPFSRTTIATLTRMIQLKRPRIPSRSASRALSLGCCNYTILECFLRVLSAAGGLLAVRDGGRIDCDR